MPVKTITRHDGKRFRFGRVRPKAFGPRLSFRNYLMRAPAITIPETCDYRLAAVNALGNMYGNDVLGDCVIAAMAHQVGVFTGGAGNEFIFTDAQIIALYSAIGGYVPGDSSTDNGCDPTIAWNYWRDVGAPAGQNQITAWMAVNAADPVEYRTALYLFENLGLGLELPDAWISPFPSASGFTWDLAGAPDPNNGHEICAAAYGMNGVIIDTWGMTGLMTDKAIAYYLGSAEGGMLYTCISPETINKARGKAPNGFDFTQLTADFQALAG